MTEEVAADEVLDAKGLTCPMPILKAKKAITKLGTGTKLKVLSTDPGSVKDFEAFSRRTGHKLLHSSEDDGVYVFVLEKK